MKLCKEQRQIIVVTHNANIPVNGDAEYIVSMDSQTLNVNVRNSGTIDNPIIRKEICDVMEGTEYAFKMRVKSIIYSSNNMNLMKGIIWLNST